MSTSLRKPTNPANFTSQEHKFPFTPIDLILDSHSEMKKMKKKIMEQQLTQFVVLCRDENFVLSSNANVINFVLFRILNLNQSIKRNRN